MLHNLIFSRMVMWRRKYFATLILPVSFIIGTGTAGMECRAQAAVEKPITFERKLDIVLTNPVGMERRNEPVTIPLALLKEKAPDFNVSCFRIKRPADDFEPLDIPSQLRPVPGDDSAQELVFLTDLGHGRTTVELWYNPSGDECPVYPKKAQSFDRWYSDGSNLAWENEVIAYRTYSGVVDFFAKAYPHLRLHDMPPDSYHHERLWGLDPYVIGTKPGLGGILLFTGTTPEKLYSGSATSQLSFEHHASGDGAVFTEAVVGVLSSGKKRLEAHYMLYAGHHDNDVTVLVSPDPGKTPGDVLVAPGMQTFDGERFVMNKRGGYCYGFGSPVGEYGTIGTALVWNPSDARGVFESDDGTFIQLKPDAEGRVWYRSTAVWYRASAGQPESPDAFESYVKGLARCFGNPVKVSIGK